MNDIIARIGESVKRHRETGWQVIVLMLIGWSAYNVGMIRVSGTGGAAIGGSVFREREAIVSQTAPVTGEGSQRPDRSDPRVVVSKASSSKKYHYSWCASGMRIKEANRLWFPSAEDAEAAGYTLAATCSR